MCLSHEFLKSIILKSRRDSPAKTVPSKISLFWTARGGLDPEVLEAPKGPIQNLGDLYMSFKT